MTIRAEKVILGLKIVTLILGILSLLLTSDCFSRHFPVLRINNTEYETRLQSSACVDAQKELSFKEKEDNKELYLSACVKQKHVVQDYVVLGFISFDLLLTLVTLIVYILTEDLPVQLSLKLLRIDGILHIIGGLLLLIAGSLWTQAAVQRSINVSQCMEEDLEHKEKCLVGQEHDGAKSFGQNNLVLYNYKSVDKAGTIFRSSRENGNGKFSEIVIDAVFILLNAIVYFILGILLIMANHSAQVTAALQKVQAQRFSGKRKRKRRPLMMRKSDGFDGQFSDRDSRSSQQQEPQELQSEQQKSQQPKSEQQQADRDQLTTAQQQQQLIDQMTPQQKQQFEQLTPEQQQQQLENQQQQQEPTRTSSQEQQQDKKKGWPKLSTLKKKEENEQSPPKWPKLLTLLRKKQDDGEDEPESPSERKRRKTRRKEEGNEEEEPGGRSRRRTKRVSRKRRRSRRKSHRRHRSRGKD